MRNRKEGKGVYTERCSSFSGGSGSIANDGRSEGDDKSG
jgi:hypothetical protein